MRVLRVRYGLLNLFHLLTENYRFVSRIEHRTASSETSKGIFSIKVFGEPHPGLLLKGSNHVSLYSILERQGVAKLPVYPSIPTPVEATFPFNVSFRHRIE
jgi:hypothetical protein